MVRGPETSGPNLGLWSEVRPNLKARTFWPEVQALLAVDVGRPRHGRRSARPPSTSSPKEVTIVVGVSISQSQPPRRRNSRRSNEETPSVVPKIRLRVYACVILNEQSSKLVTFASSGIPTMRIQQRVPGMCSMTLFMLVIGSWGYKNPYWSRGKRKISRLRTFQLDSRAPGRLAHFQRGESVTDEAAHGEDHPSYIISVAQHEGTLRVLAARCKEPAKGACIAMGVYCDLKNRPVPGLDAGRGYHFQTSRFSWWCSCQV